LSFSEVQPIFSKRRNIGNIFITSKFYPTFLSFFRFLFYSLKSAQKM